MSDLALNPGSDASRVLAAVLFINASTNIMDTFSALNSSPWTAENFGADPDKAASCREYVYHGLAFSGLYVTAAGVLAKSWWPIIGGAVAGVYMFWLYDRALRRGSESGSGAWRRA